MAYPPRLTAAARTGGLTAALVNFLLNPPDSPVSAINSVASAVTCQDLGNSHAQDFHWPSLVLGILIGLLLVQLLDLIYLIRQYLGALVRQKLWGLSNHWQVKNRLA